MRILLVHDDNGNLTADNDCLESQTDASYFYHQDANYNVVAVTDASGEQVLRVEYTAYDRPTFYDAQGRQLATPDFGPSGNTCVDRSRSSADEDGTTICPL